MTPTPKPPTRITVSVGPKGEPRLMQTSGEPEPKQVTPRFVNMAHPIKQPREWHLNRSLTFNEWCAVVSLIAAIVLIVLVFNGAVR